jgi:YggT family protein
MEAITNSATFLISSLGTLYVLAVLLRFLLQIAHADFYNPLSQAVVRITNPLVKIFRTFIPGYKGIDFPILILAFVLEAAALCSLVLLYGGSIPSIATIVTLTLAGIVLFIINIYFYAIIASIVMSWIMMFSGSTNPHPILHLIWQLTEPVMAPIRKIIPPMGGLDISPIFVFLGLQLVRGFVEASFGISGVERVLLLGI